MSYQDITLTPASGYTYVHIGQIYDAIAARLTAHSAWQYVEYVDYVVSGTTNRTHVWKCLSSSSGLPADFFVLFTVRFTTATGVYETVSSGFGSGMQILLCEVYNSTTKVASKLAPYGSATTFSTLASDGSHSMTWTLTTARPSSAAAGAAFVWHGTSSSRTSYRFLIGVTNDVIFVAGSETSVWTYVGAFETILSSADDPMPLILGFGGALGNSFFNSYQFAACTRHPGLSGSVQYSHSFAFTAGHFYQPSAGLIGYPLMVNYAYSGSSGLLGDPANPDWGRWLGGVQVAKVPFSTSGSGNTAAAARGSVLGGLRGYLKYMRFGPLAAHSLGDTFQAEGKTFVGMGATTYGLWDTTA